jgi:toxin ParE1/3/4
MIRLRLSEGAREDLRDIRRYSVATFGREVADAYLRGFAKVFRLLQQQPQLGEAQPKIGESARVYKYRRHRIVYRATDTEVMILIIAHQARDLVALTQTLRMQ